MTQEHPYSTFALDLYWADPSRAPDVGAHVATCQRCRTYVEHLGAMDARPLALPARRTPIWRRRFVAAFALAVAVAACLLVFVRGTTEHASQESSYVASKGAPGAQVLVRRDGATRSWDGAEKIREHDTLALRVACEAMARVTVLVVDRGSWKSAFDGACVNDVLPFTLVVDDQPGDERVAVVFSRDMLDDAAAARAATLQTQSADVWALAFKFAKESRR